MVELPPITDRILNSRLGTLVARLRLGRLLGILATSIFVLAGLSWYQRNQVDEAYSNQIILNQILILTRQMHSLKLGALQKQSLPPAAESERRSARRALHQMALAFQLHRHQTVELEQVWPAFDSYIASADRQWILMQVGDFDQAKQEEFQACGPQFDLMQRQVQVAQEAEALWAQRAALRARYELLVAGILAAAAVLMLFLRVKEQEHSGQLQEAEQNALRESEERFRALSEQSADIILIADPSGQIKYASPSVHAVLAVPGESLVGASMIDLVHPEDIAKTLGAGSRSAAFGTIARQNPIVETRLRHANGTWLHFECVVRNLI